VKLAYLDKVLGKLVLDELKLFLEKGNYQHICVFGLVMLMMFMFVQVDELQNINLIIYLKWLQERVMDEY
jgi:hypothetical protein